MRRGYLKMQGLVTLILAMDIAMATPAIANIKIPCGSSSMLTNFIPCMNFMINSNPNKFLPTNQCCEAFRSLTAGGMDCFCLFLNDASPFSFPIQRILATYLSQVCGISDVFLLHCNKIYGSLPPASGPVSPRKSLSTPSEVASSPHLEASHVIPSTNATLMNSSSSTMASGGHSLLISSSSMPSYTLSPFLLIAFGLVVLKYC